MLDCPDLKPIHLVRLRYCRGFTLQSGGGGGVILFCGFSFRRQTFFPRFLSHCRSIKQAFYQAREQAGVAKAANIETVLTVLAYPVETPRAPLVLSTQFSIRRRSWSMRRAIILGFLLFLREGSAEIRPLTANRFCFCGKNALVELRTRSHPPGRTAVKMRLANTPKSGRRHGWGIMTVHGHEALQFRSEPKLWREPGRRRLDNDTKNVPVAREI